MQPQPSLPTAQFQDWYNNEHGPGRLRLPFCENGFRYCGTDLEGSGKGMPEWMAVYDITDMAEMNKETYLRLRRAGVQSQVELLWGIALPHFHARSLQGQFAGYDRKEWDELFPEGADLNFYNFFPLSRK